MRVSIYDREYRSREEVRQRMEELSAEYPSITNPGSRARLRRVAPRALEEFETLDGHLEELKKEQRSLERLARDPRHLEREREVFDDPAAASAFPAGAFRSRALAANEQASFLPEEARAHMEEQLREDDDPEVKMARYVIETSKRSYFRAFSRWLNDPTTGPHTWSPEERDAVRSVQYLSRAMGIGTGGAGGFLVPYELDPQILIASAGAVSPLREIARVVTTAQNEKRLVTSLGVTASWDLEAEEVSDDSPTLLQPAIVCKKGQAFVPISIELWDDSDIAEQVGRLFADAKAVHEALSFTITQAQGPNGIITALVAAGGATVIATGTNVLAAADLYANQAALPARWRPNAKWMMNLSILNGYRQLPQATGLNYSIVNDDGPLPKALGWEIRENSSMDSTLTGAAADYLVLSGDFEQFAIVDRIGTAIEIVPTLFGANRRPTGQRGVHMHWRTGSDVLIPDAFRLSNFST